MFEWVKLFRDKKSEDGEEIYNQPVVATNAEDEDADVVTTRNSHDSSFYQNMIDQYFANFSPDAASLEELINTYRDLEEIQEVDFAVQEIVDQAIVVEDAEDPVRPNFDNTDYSDKVKEKLNEAWDDLIRITRFKDKGQGYFRRWYVDSRIHFYISVNEKSKEIENIYRLDPRKTSKIKEYITKHDSGTQQDLIVGVNEYYLYTPNTKEIGTLKAMGLRLNNRKFKIPRESISSAYSGLTDRNGNTISYLHRAIRNVNQLKMLEDSIVVYRIARAPERLAFYVDTSGMGTKAGTKKINEMKEGLRRKSTYDPKTGKVSSQYDVASIGENYWMQRKNGKNTEIQQLSGAANLGEIQDIEYFDNKVWDSLRLPKSRREQGAMFGGGREMEISRDELRFDKYISRLRNEFKVALLDIYRVVVVLKNIMTREEFDAEFQNIHLDFTDDSFFKEAKELEMFREKAAILRDVDEHVGVGKYFSREWVRRNLLKQSDEEIKEIAKQNEAEPVPEPEEPSRGPFG